MKTIGKAIAIVASLIFELLGRLLAQIATWSMSIAEMLLRTINEKG